MEILNLIQDQSATIATPFSFFIGILTVYMLTIILKCFLFRLILQFISLISFVYQKHTFILVLLLVMVITIKEGVLVFITNVFYLYELSMSNIFKKVYVLNLKLVKKLVIFLSVYRSPRQSHDDFETFTENLGLNSEKMVQKNPFLVVAIGDLNAKSSN